MTTAPDPIRALAEAQVGRCHLCAFLRQEHRDGMGHRPDARIGVDPQTVLALLDQLAAAEARVAALEGALGEAAAELYEQADCGSDDRLVANAARVCDAARALLARAASPGQGL